MEGAHDEHVEIVATEILSERVMVCRISRTELAKRLGFMKSQARVSAIMADDDETKLLLSIVEPLDE